MDAFSIRRMAKIELHAHLEGTLEPGLAARLAARNDVRIQNPNADGANGHAYNDLASFLTVYRGNISVLVTKQDFFELCWAFLKRCRDECIIHCDLFFDPQAHTSRGVAFGTVIEGLMEARQKAKEDLGISASLIMCFLRDMGVNSAMATLDEAANYRHAIEGVGLDSNEKESPPRKFTDVFGRARAEGYKLTCHCDVNQPNSIEHVRQAIEDIGVDRIDHGTNVIEDDVLVQKVFEKGIGLTCCPASNLVAARNFKGSDILSLLRRGIRVTINSGHPAYFRATLSDNLIKLTMETDVRRVELIKMQRIALELAWVNDEQRAKLKAAFDQWVISIELCG